jgi:hypothetical protein
MFENIDEGLLFNLIAFGLGLSYGVLAQRKQFCFSGGIKDIVLFNHTKRTASLIMAMISAIISTQAMTYIYDVDLTNSVYLSNINYIFIVIGGIMFGFGMMISDGCSSRHLIKLSQGEKDSFWILGALSLFAYISYKTLSIYNDEILSIAFISSARIEFVSTIPIYAALAVLAGLLYKTVKSWKNLLECWDGALIGLVITAGWFVTTYFADDFFINISNQSLSFVYPVGKMFEFFVGMFDMSVFIFPVWIVIGVVAGGFISSRFNKEFSKKQMCDNTGLNPPKLFTKMIGGAFMGMGGILSVGCTVGQGLSGVSTLAYTSFIAISSIYIAAFVTARYLQKRNGLIACFIFDFKN